uniref:Uncharacterized protein n=1 Tax=Vespula pensylvanica TaxID=30213 RepID=A0A834NM06_VESPE|nr:hypothetical protein H0235_013179 [Vespula pensylvanica]
MRLYSVKIEKMHDDETKFVQSSCYRQTTIKVKYKGRESLHLDDLEKREFIASSIGGSTCLANKAFYHSTHSVYDFSDEYGQDMNYKSDKVPLFPLCAHFITGINKRKCESKERTDRAKKSRYSRTFLRNAATENQKPATVASPSAWYITLLFTLLALVSPIFSEEALRVKKHEKRGILGLGYGYGGGIGGLGGFGHGGYVGNSASYSLGHGGYGTAPLVSHGYNDVPIPLSHGYSAPTYPTSYLDHSAIALGHGFGGGHGFGYHGL